MSVSHVPAAEVEIGEQEHQQGGAEDRLRRCAIDPFRHLGQREDPLQEAEIDACIGQHRPGQSGGRREDDRTLHHEDDREEQGEQAGNADDNAFVERQPSRFLAVGLLVPQVDLGNVRPLQLRHERHGGAGIDRDHELVGLGVVLAVGPDALARGDRGDAGPAEIRPDHPGADEPEMRRHKEPVDLFVGVVGEREDHPIRPRTRVARLHDDAPDDPVLAGCRRDLDEVAVGAIALDHRRQVDGRRVEGQPHGLHGLGGPACGQHGEDNRQKSGQDLGGDTQRANVPAGGGVPASTAQVGSESYRWGMARARRGTASRTSAHRFLTWPDTVRSPRFAAKTSR